MEEAASGGWGRVRRLRRRYGRAGQGGTTNKQTDRQTDRQTVCRANTRNITLARSPVPLRYASMLKEISFLSPLS